MSTKHVPEGRSGGSISRRLGTIVAVCAVTALTALALPATAVAVVTPEAPPVYELQWGSYGSGDGQFNRVNGVAVSDDGSRVYVAGHYGRRVQVFDTNGNFLFKWSTANGGEAADVEIDSAGNVYVVEHNRHYVLVYNADGTTLLRSIGGAGGGDGQLSYPTGVAVADDGSIYVADRNNNRIQKFESDGTFDLKWGSYGSEEGQFWGLGDVEVNGHEVFTTESGNDRVQVFDLDGNFLRTWGETGATPGSFRHPAGIAFDDDGDVFVADYGNSRVQKFDKLGAFLTEWGSPGTGDGEFTGPNFVEVGPTGAIFVTEHNSVWPPVAHRVQKFVYANNPPVADANGPYVVDEGSTISLDGTGSYDVDDDPLTFLWSPSTNLDDPTRVTPLYTGVDDAFETISLTVTDSNGLSDTTESSVTVNNVPPTITSLTSPGDPVTAYGNEVSVTVDFIDAGAADTHEVTWSWGDGESDVRMNADSPANQGHVYDEPGVYSVAVTVTDDDGAVDFDVFEYVVVFDPAGGFVTGGGWIDSPSGAYLTDPHLTGRANFGFVSKYKKGASTPTGNTEFQFHAGDLSFHSSSYDWLVIAGQDRAKYKGSGTINGTGNYGFMLTAVDNGNSGDTFRIKIWDKDNSDAVVYDNQIGSGDDGYDGTIIGGGNIKVHKK